MSFDNKPSNVILFLLRQTAATIKLHREEIPDLLHHTLVDVGYHGEDAVFRKLTSEQQMELQGLVERYMTPDTYQQLRSMLTAVDTGQKPKLQLPRKPIMRPVPPEIHG